MACQSFPGGAYRTSMVWVVMTILGLLLFGCNNGSSSNSDGDGEGDVNNGSGAITSGDYVVLAWNDLGMHCLNPTYDQLVILPPYNTLWAQVIERGNPPRVVTSGFDVTYSIQDNSTSLGKFSYDQFWTQPVLDLFGAAGLAPDTGLNLRDPTIHNGLSGSMQLVGDHFQADGIPLTPVNDSSITTKNPYQVAIITVKDATGATLVQTHAMAPTSDEINCGKCHAPGGTLTQAFADILQKHDTANQTDLQNSTPVLCASCHGSPVLGANGRGSANLYLSEAIHGFHANKAVPTTNAAIACYDCHPGQTTQCSRSLAHTAADGNCIDCHGTMGEMATQINTNTKVPWVDEPKCIECHAGVAEVDTGTTLYRNAMGHGGLYCAGCHQSPHAMIPSREATDNYQALQYQNKSVPMGSCRVCHSTSRPEGGNLGEFSGQHGGTNPDVRSACGVCHTGLPNSVSAAEFPHQFTWNQRSN